MRVRACVKNWKLLWSPHNITYSTTGKVMDSDKIFLLCFQVNSMTFWQPSILTPKNLGQWMWVASIPYSWVMERGRILGLLPGMGPSIRIRLSILPLLGKRAFVTRFVEFYVTYTNTVIGHILWLPLSTIGTTIGGYLFLISTLDENDPAFGPHSVIRCSGIWTTFC